MGGVAGYLTTVKKSGTVTQFTGEAFTNTAGNTYQITDATKQVWDREITHLGSGAYALTFYEDSVAIATSDITSVDFLFGKVTFATSKSGAITADGWYHPMTAIAGANSYNLNMSGTIHDTTDYATAQGNSGFRTRGYGLRDVSATISQFDQVNDEFIGWINPFWRAQSNSGAFANAFDEAVYGSSKWVVVGDAGEIQYSTDGETWTVATADDSYAGAFNGLCFGGGMFVAVGSGGEIQTSMNGVTWTKNTNVDNAYSDAFAGVCYSATIFKCVAVGENGEIQVAGPPDGPWTARSADESSAVDTFYKSVVDGTPNGTGRIVACGTGGMVQYSDDGVTWNQGNIGGGYTGTLRRVIFSKRLDRYIMVGYTAEIQTSEDGITWTSRDISPLTTVSLHGVWEDDGLIVAVGNGPTLLVSEDGIDWKLQSAYLPSGTANMRTVGYGNSQWLMAGDSGEILTAINVLPKPVLLEIRPGGAGDYARGWFFIDSVAGSGDVDALEDLSISFQCDGYGTGDDDDITAFNWGT